MTMTQPTKPSRMINHKNTPDDVTMLLEHRRPVGEGVASRMPVFKTMLYTLDISSRFLVNAAVGKGTVACADRLIDGYWRRILSSGNAELRAIGRRHFEPGKPYIVMSNHASLLDIPVMMGAIPGSMRMVMKEELTRVPVWGQALVASGFVPIDRKNRTKAIGQLERAKAMLTKGVTLWVSPEGTRARDGKLAAFKKGGFHVALDLGVPIIPAFIDGAFGIIPPDQFVVLPDGEITVRFGAPIETRGRSKDDLEPLMDTVRDAILELSGRRDEIDGAPRRDSAVRTALAA
jgi:1-acyl-sn-glycerol-3-phosphate acyltransferase